MCSYSSAACGRMQAFATISDCSPWGLPRPRGTPVVGRPPASPLISDARGLYSPLPGARGGIGRRARLRALWRLFSVVVRVHSGA
jgi:hypothetical protein